MARCARRPRYASTGQALIMAVLIMFLLVGLSGLFIAMINNAMVQVAQAAERDRLERIALAGITMAQGELLHSADGADWRPDNSTGPDENNPGWVHYDKGFYKVNVHYGPQDVIDMNGTPSASNPAFLDNPLERYIRIDVEARFALQNPPNINDDNPEADAYHDGFTNGKRYITRKLTAFMPIELTDNLLWVTNLDGATDPIILGSTFHVSDYNDDAKLTTINKDPATISDDSQYEDSTVKTTIDSVNYLPIYDGPIRCDADIEVANLGIYLTDKGSSTTDYNAYRSNFFVNRADQFIVAGHIGQYSNGSSPSLTSKYLLNHTDSFASSGADIIPTSADMSSLPLDFVQCIDNNPLVRRIEPPRLDQRDRITGLDRYRTLTRDTVPIDQRDAQIVQGEGLYINNAEQIEFDGKQDDLHTEWLNTEPFTYLGVETKQPHWKNGKYFPQIPDKGQPGATEITLQDYGQPTLVNGDSTPDPVLYESLPKIRITNYDEHGNVIDVKEVAYPRNGVIFAEGNLVVKGNLPASLDLQDDKNGHYIPVTDSKSHQLPGGYAQDSSRGDEVRYYVNDTNRRYDLTIVSGGTIYIEGNLLSPSTRTASLADDNANKIKAGDPRDSKLALLAMDNVCLNPTLTVTVGDMTDTWNDDGYWMADNSKSISLHYTTAGDIKPQTHLLLRHGGAKVDGGDLAAIRMVVQGSPYYWHPVLDPTQPSTYPLDQLFFADAYKMLTDPTGYLSGYNASWLGGGVDAPEEYTLNSWSLYDINASAGRHFPDLPASQPTPLQGNGSMNTMVISWAQGTTQYLLSSNNDDSHDGVAVSGGDIQVDALVYAQRGSWYVIPGKYFNNEKDEAGQPIDDKWPNPKYHEPLDIHITVNGAIVMNRPVPLDMEEESQRHWRGSNLDYYTTDGTTPALWDPKNATWNGNLWRWTDRRMGISYHYDATLMIPACYTRDEDGAVETFFPRLPKLPVSPTTFSFGAIRGA
ncbi:MAG TPA: hypothetical protein VHV83_11390 [Armatimonadota bacterium]|nr:hypothetical protein [Armatimonadota bacterium]